MDLLDLVRLRADQERVLVLQLSENCRSRLDLLLRCGKWSPASAKIRYLDLVQSPLVDHACVYQAVKSQAVEYVQSIRVGRMPCGERRCDD